MDSQSILFETPTRKPTTRFRDREGEVQKQVQADNAKSPSQRLKDLFFATYTGVGGSTSAQASQKSSQSRYTASLTSAVLQTPTKVPQATASTQGSGVLAETDDMEVDESVAQERLEGDGRDGEGWHMKEEDLRGPAVPLAIATTGRFYSEHMRRCELRIELMGLSALGHNPRGVYVMPSLGSINVWYGVMFVKRGYWRDAVIRFRIDIPREYPRTHPVITMGTSVSHPLVRLEDGRFGLEQQFPQWTAYSDYIYHALHYLKNAFKNRVLKQLQPRDCYNIGAYMKFKSDLPQFREHARIDSMKSRLPESLFKTQPPDCPIVFSPLSDEQYEGTMQQMRTFVAATKPAQAVH
ncbi:hypothetical protein H4R24_000156 [Coemansia sp. RSA 988]|nr:hypothetical protein H4R24_000156 [Coemansia sp. RSA 988]